MVADATTMKDWCGDSHPATMLANENAFRLRPHFLKLKALQFDKNAERTPQNIVELVDLISHFLCGHSCYYLSEHLHLSDCVALETKKLSDAMDMEILVRKKPFREEKQGDFINAVDSDDETIEKPNRLRAEFLGGSGESD